MAKGKFPFHTLLPIKPRLLLPASLSQKIFKPKVPIRIERGGFIIKTAENKEELSKALKLRHEVFYRELLDRKRLFGIDVDKFDFLCDHLIVIDKKADCFIGTYRLISSLFSKKFYSQTEFNIDAILDLAGNKLELGRACVHRDYRTGSTFSLLWRGITDYMRKTDTRYLFGCSSVKTVDTRHIAALHTFFKGDHSAPARLRVTPRRKFAIRRFDALVNDLSDQEVSAAAGLVPPLINWYFRNGAQVCGEPALDKKFKCADFLTLFNIEDLSAKGHRKYNL